jgi:hypothetical protein
MRLGAPTPSPTRRGVVSLTFDWQGSRHFVQDPRSGERADCGRAVSRPSHLGQQTGEILASSTRRVLRGAT